MANRLGASALRTHLACPRCHGKLDWGTGTIRCVDCGSRYPVVDEIPVMVPAGDGPEPPEDTTYKRRQSEYFDEPRNAEFEVTRPRDAPRLYGWLMDQKLQRSLSGLNRLAGLTALTVCGGSGMDAELLSRRGLSVIASDISLGAARRARERARRFDLPLEVVVADVEQLPFAGNSIDLVYVHDGLHHLGDPLAGLHEMARVAARAVSVNEPARAAATALAVRVGLSSNVEEAGNRVERMRLNDIVTALEGDGFRATEAERYAMLYRHEPGPAMKLLSAPGLFQAAKLGWRALNLAAGRFGNKLTVQATR